MLNIMLKRFHEKKIFRFFLFLTIFHVNLYAQNLLNGPNDIVFDEANNRYLVANWAGNSIVAIDLDGNQQLFIDSVSHAHGMECRDSVLYVASDHSLVLINLFTAEIIENINVSYSQNLSHITLDSSHFVYMTDWSVRRLFRVDLNNRTSTILYSFSAIPGGVSYDENNNRLIILSYVNNAPILGYNLSTGNLSTIINTSISNHVAICQDASSNYYITSSSDNIVYKFGNNFTTGPEIISSGHNYPSGLGYNRRDHIIGVTNYNSNSIDLIPPEPIEVKHEQEIKPADYMLFQNYPNPFNSSTNIRFNVNKLSEVTIRVYDVNGRLIRSLLSRKIFNKGIHQIIWDGKNEHGIIVGSGLYFYKINIEGYSELKHMIMLN